MLSFIFLGCTHDKFEHNFFFQENIYFHMSSGHTLILYQIYFLGGKNKIEK